MPKPRGNANQYNVSGTPLNRRTFISAVTASVVRQGLISAQTTTERIGSTSERLQLKPYERRLCRVESYPKCLMPDVEYDISVEEYVSLIHAAGVDVQIVAGEMDRGIP